MDSNIIERMVEEKLIQRADAKDPSRGFRFDEDYKQVILNHSSFLFDNCPHDELSEKMDEFLDVLIQFMKNNIRSTLLSTLQKHTTSEKRQNIKEENLQKAINYIFDYLGGELVITNERATLLRNELIQLRKNPLSFQNLSPEQIKKADFKAYLRKIIQGKSKEIDNFAGDLPNKYF